MKLVINQKEKEFSSSLNLSQIIDSLELPTSRGLALAVNSEVIHKAGWETFIPTEGDNIILMQAVQGG